MQINITLNIFRRVDNGNMIEVEIEVGKKRNHFPLLKDRLCKYIILMKDNESITEFHCSNTQSY